MSKVREDGVLSPLMRQYAEIKARYADCTLLFRLGDFYEMFGEDAIAAAPILGVVLTRRQDVPMCGVPHHSATTYIKRLLAAGRKVAVCEQLEDPAAARGVVRRDVVRIITPGTVLEDDILEPGRNNYLVAVVPFDAPDGMRVGIAAVDISTGEFRVSRFHDPTGSRTVDELQRIYPSEIILPAEREEALAPVLSTFASVHRERLEGWRFDVAAAAERLKAYFGVVSLDGFGLSLAEHPEALAAVGGVLSYLEMVNKRDAPRLAAPRIQDRENRLAMDASCIRNLELVENLHDRSTANTLLETLDRTVTPMGGRLLRRRILEPLVDATEIGGRLHRVELLFGNPDLLEKVRTMLRRTGDMERAVNRVTAGTANPRELRMIAETLRIVPEIMASLREAGRALLFPDEVWGPRIPPLDDVVGDIDAVVSDDPPADVSKGGVIRDGYSRDLDELRSIATSSRTWLTSFQEQARQRTGIATLKAGYTSVFGYYVEVGRSAAASLPPDFQRIQTLKNAERFTTPELKSFEEKLLTCEERIARLEPRLYAELVARVAQRADDLRGVAGCLAEVDVTASLALVARENGYCKPELSNEPVLDLRASRHPVVERLMPTGSFIPNDINLDARTRQVLLITGPNMAGKSTYIRQAALIVVMAQMGSFVPCDRAVIGLVDRVFARIGAGDRLARGLSTFMVEMQETASILNNAGERSLVILDEIGRGTSTYDGVSIAWACVEHLVARPTGREAGPRTLFATHYFELIELGRTHPVVVNMNVAVREEGRDIVFLHRVEEGASDRSYGIHVAQLAGIPPSVVRRAEEILARLERRTERAGLPEARSGHPAQFELPLDEDGDAEKYSRELLEALNKFDINNRTPLEALAFIQQWQRKNRS